MENKLTHLLITVFTILGSISCSKDWLDKKPDKNLTVPETLLDFEAMLDNTDLNARSALSIGEVASDEHYVLESRWATGFADFLSNAYTWSNNRPYLNLADWNAPYHSILVSNVVLEGIDKIKYGIERQDQVNRIKGGGLFNRARHLYELAQIFCVPYDSSSARSDIGLPIRAGSDITIPTIRSTVEETYNRIIDDLTEAKRLLPEIPLYRTRASKPAAFALLARVYLSMRDYQNAGRFADSCLAYFNALLDYNSIDLNTNYIGSFNAEVVFHSISSPYNIIASSAKIETGLVNKYDSNDLRKKAFFKTESTGTRVFKGNYFSGTATLFFGMTTAEMYLVRAECYARAGNMEKAMLDLNTLYRKRWDMNVPYVDLTAIDANHALEQVLLERRKELLLRGQRWSDLRRLNKESNFSVTLTRTVGGATYTLEPNSYQYTFPIPDDVIQLSGIQQNPEWGD